MKNKSNESGRTMLEMLGVLAVIGVLSVAGIAGYSAAMNRHRANELLNEASKRAVVVAGQLLLTSDASEISLAQFGNNTIAGISFGENAMITNNQIVLTLSGATLTDLCPQMITLAGDNSIMYIDEDCSKITFNADLSKGVTPASSQEDPTAECGSNVSCVASNGTASCVNGHCTCESGMWVANAGASNSQIQGTCINASGSCTTSADCFSASACSYGEGNCYCRLSNSGCNVSSGSCVSKGNLSTMRSFNDKEFYVGSPMTWWNAKNWCEAHGLRLASIADLGLARPGNNNGCSFPGRDPTQLQNACNKDPDNCMCKNISGGDLPNDYGSNLDTTGIGRNPNGYDFFWLSDGGAQGNSCYAFRLYTGYKVITNSERHNYGNIVSPLCVR